MDRSFNMERYLMAHSQILNANLSPRTELLAHRLLALCGGSDGQVNLSWEEFSFMTDCYNVNAARRHLTRLSQRGIIHYSTKDVVYIGFVAWGLGGSPGGGPLRAYALPVVSARAARGGAEAMEELLFGVVDAPVVARNDGNLQVGALPMAREEGSHSHARMLVSLLDPPPGNEEEELTNCPEPGSPLGADPEPGPENVDEAKRTLRLLMDRQVGVDFQAARRIAGSYSFELVERHVFSWRRDIEAGKVNGPGALVHRIKVGFGAIVTKQDRCSVLYRRHHPDWQREEEDSCRKQYRVEFPNDRRYNRPEDYTDLEI
jgi:hypothetical protein